MANYMVRSFAPSVSMQRYLYLRCISSTLPNIRTGCREHVVLAAVVTLTHRQECKSVATGRGAYHVFETEVLDDHYCCVREEDNYCCNAHPDPHLDSF